uniref:Aminopeptidase N-like N-terminal domain-containing protein n=1 Tax=Panagrolaimus superbus TaxID=310955 RepID=A0A914YRK2_9BILA
MDVVKPTSTIILNAHELVFSAKKNFKVFSYFPPSNGSAVVNVLGWKESPESEAIIINLERKLKEDEKIVIIITYSGKIGVNSETGFYKSVKDGDIVYATMFQTTGARSVFPCFDEPEYKAEFKIEIAKPKTWTALSNTMEENIKDLG